MLVRPFGEVKLFQFSKQKKWGDLSYTPEKFKSSPLADKAKMASSILLDKTLIGRTVEQVREKFGPPDGFYFIDSYPAYIIQEGKNQKEETWQIVFLHNAEYKIREIIVHKNCCEKK